MHPECLSLAELQERTRGESGEKRALTFAHLVPIEPIEQRTFLGGRGGTYLVSGCRACNLVAAAAATLFEPLEREEQVRELLTRFEPGRLVTGPQTLALARSLRAAGLQLESVELPAGGLRVEREELGLAVDAVMLRRLAGGGEVVLKSWSFPAAGLPSGSEGIVVRVAPPIELESHYRSAGPPRPLGSIEAQLRREHEEQLELFWRTVKATLGRCN